MQPASETIEIAPPSTSIDRAGWRALAASWIGWLFDGYETYALVLVMGVAVPTLLPPGELPRASQYMGGLLAATLVGWATGGVSPACSPTTSAASAC